VVAAHCDNDGCTLVTTTVASPARPDQGVGLVIGRDGLGIIASTMGLNFTSVGLHHCANQACTTFSRAARSAVTSGAFSLESFPALTAAPGGLPVLAAAQQFIIGGPTAPQALIQRCASPECSTATFGAVRTTAMVLLIIGMAGAFSWLMAFLRVPASLVAWMNTISENPIVVLLLINVLMLVLGTFMDMGPTIIICTPIFLPVAIAYGIDPVHFGVIMILNFGIGLNTPPVGAVQFVACAVGKISVWESMRSIWPFYGAGLVVLGLVTYIPALSLWLPSVFR
jgi:hypothetical protein